MLAAIGVFLTIFITDSFFNNLKKIFNLFLEPLTFSSIFYFLLVIGAVGLFLLGVFNLIIVLVPNLSNDSSKYSTNISPINSIYYFEGISNSAHSEFENKVLTINQEEVIKDLIHQVYLNAKIATKKYHLYKYGVFSSTVGIAFLFVLYIVGLTLLKFGG